MKDLEQQNAALKRELDLKKQAEGEYAKRGARQQRDLRDLQSKASAQEITLEQVVRAFETERSGIASKTQAQFQKIESALISTKRLLELKSRELRTIRGLAQEVRCRHRGYAY